MAKTILSKNQIKILNAISADVDICKNFYLTGGTALAEFYFSHRLSEDLDFFSEQEFEPQAILIFLKKNQKKLNIIKIDYQQSFNRHLFFLHLKNEIIKTEFTFFPFPRIEKKTKKNNLSVDSMIDIAVNKLFTIYQKPRARDFIDLYFIKKKCGLSIKNLIKKARIKFDWHIDYLELGSQFLLVKEVKDYPKMIKKIKPQLWQEYFIKEAGRLKKEILS